jgi:serine/threonine protein kinase/Tol biopolymer transport system component
MPLLPGTRLGPYEVISVLGAGGMGEVYKARDTRLERTVAIKVVPSHSASAESRRRLEREARAISALDHPHICALYDVGHHDGIDFLVMQYLEGETLAERLRRGAMPIDQLLRIGIDIADALDRAHRAGIVHRDLKPGNIMLTASGAKLLDFGIAKAVPLAAPEAATVGAPAGDDVTRNGAVSGTLSYMAPEQLKGWRVDARSDLFSLGAVLYEMASGARAFVGATPAAVIDAVLNQQPPSLAALVPGVSPAIIRLVGKCLNKDVEERWQTARDLKDELQWIVANAPDSLEPRLLPPTPRRHGAHRARWIAGAALVAGAVALSALSWTESSFVRRTLSALTRGNPAPGDPRGAAPPARTTTREAAPPIASAATMPLQLSIALPKELTIRAGGPELALSPDGRRVAFRAFSRRGWMLYLRSLDSSEVTLLPGTEYARYAFWSPDGAALGFFSEGKLKTIDLIGNSVRVLCDAPSPRGGAWNGDGTIIFAATGDSNGVYAVTATGGTPRPLTSIDRTHGERRHEWPIFLPGGRRFLYAIGAKGSPQAGIYLQALDVPGARQVFTAASNVGYASGNLVFAKGGTLWAVPFDVDRAEATGAPRELASQLLTRGDRAEYSVVDSVLAYWRSGEIAGQVSSLDRSGKVVQTFPSPLTINDPAFSPDGRLVAFAAAGGSPAGSDIWLLEWANGNRRRLTLDSSHEYNPVWSPDGKRLVFASDRQGGMNLYQKDLATGRESLLLESDAEMYPTDWSRDGQFIIFEKRQSVGGARDLWVLPTSGDRRPFAIVATEADERQGQLSPDNRWLAYTSKESGRWQVYVRSFRVPSRVWQVSPDEGVQPAWGPDSAELFYLTGERHLMAVTIKRGDSFDLSAPKRLFSSPVANMHPRGLYSVSTDGRRFLFSAVSETAAELITVVTNWAATSVRR